MSNWTIRPWMNGVPPTLTPKDNLRRARALMRTAKVTDLLVVDDGRLVGVLNEQDIWNRCPSSVYVLDEHQADDLLGQIHVGGVMTLHPTVVTPETSLREAAQLFAQSGRTALPVVEDGILTGLLTQSSIMQAAAVVLGETQ